MSLLESILPAGGGANPLHWPAVERVRTFARQGFSRSPTVRIPGKRPIQFTTDRVRAAPAISPTVSTMLGMGAIGLGMWGLLAPKSVSRFLGIPASTHTVRTLFGVRELITGYTLAGDPTKSGMLWTRFAGDLFDIAVLRMADNPRNPQRKNARFALNAVLLITALDAFAAIRMSTVKRNCVEGGQ